MWQSHVSYFSLVFIPHSDKVRCFGWLTSFLPVVWLWPHGRGCCSLAEHKAWGSTPNISEEVGKRVFSETLESCYQSVLVTWDRWTNDLTQNKAASCVIHCHKMWWCLQTQIVLKANLQVHGEQTYRWLPVMVNFHYITTRFNDSMSPNSSWKRTMVGKKYIFCCSLWWLMDHCGKQDVGPDGSLCWPSRAFHVLIYCALCPLDLCL